MQFLYYCYEFYTYATISILLVNCQAAIFLKRTLICGTMS